MIHHVPNTTSRPLSNDQRSNLNEPYVHHSKLPHSQPQPTPPLPPPPIPIDSKGSHVPTLDQLLAELHRRTRLPTPREPQPPTRTNPHPQPQHTTSHRTPASAHPPQPRRGHPPSHTREASPPTRPLPQRQQTQFSSMTALPTPHQDQPPQGRSHGTALLDTSIPATPFAEQTPTTEMSRRQWKRFKELRRLRKG